MKVDLPLNKETNPHQIIMYEEKMNAFMIENKPSLKKKKKKEVRGSYFGSVSLSAGWGDTLHNLRNHE